MKIWEQLGLNTKETRIEKNVTNNNHSTIKWIVGCVTALFIVYLMTR